MIAVKRIGNGYGTFKEDVDLSGQISDPKVSKELAKQTIRLPNYVTLRKGISNTIDNLEEYNLKYLSNWQNQPWLKGSLGVIFDENGCFELNHRGGILQGREDCYTYSCCGNRHSDVLKKPGTKKEDIQFTSRAQKSKSFCVLLYFEP